MQRLAWLGLLLLCHPALILAQGKAARRPPRSEAPEQNTPDRSMTGEFSMRGQVVDASTGEPVRKAAVRIHGGGSDPADGVTFTDAGGGFSFHGLEAGTFSISAEKPGYSSEISPKNLVSQSIKVGPGADAAVMRLKLVRQGVLTGKVRDENNEPAPNAMVQAFRRVVQLGRGEWLPAGGQVTNDVGEYRISVQPGAYLVAVTVNNVVSYRGRGRGRRIGDDKPVVTYPAVFYPNVTDPQSAVPVALASGQEQHADFMLMPGTTFQVRGRITNIPQQRGVGLSMLPLHGDPTVRRYGGNFEMGDGSFVFTGIPAGMYQIMADSFSGPEDHLAARQTVTVGESDVTGVEITLGPVFSVPVQVRTDDGSAAPGVQVSMSNDSSHQAVSMGLDKNGLPILAGLAPGTYRMGVSAGNRYYVKSATLGGVDVLDRNMEWNGPSGPLEIVLGSKGGSLSGHIASQGLAAAEVLVLRKTPEGQFALARQVHANGADFTASALAPGSYVVLAAEDVQNLEYADPAVLKKYQDYTQSVSVDENGEQQLQLKLAPVL